MRVCTLCVCEALLSRKLLVVASALRFSKFNFRVGEYLSFSSSSTPTSVLITKVDGDMAIIRKRRMRYVFISMHVFIYRIRIDCALEENFASFLSSLIPIATTHLLLPVQTFELERAKNFLSRIEN